MDNAFKQGFVARMFARDLARYTALSDARKAQNAAARARCQADVSLCAILQAEASRRGETRIDWAEYFRNVRI